MVCSGEMLAWLGLWEKSSDGEGMLSASGMGTVFEIASVVDRGSIAGHIRSLLCYTDGLAVLLIYMRARRWEVSAMQNVSVVARRHSHRRRLVVSWAN